MQQVDTYQPKHFNLSGLNGISDQTLEMHFKLYEGYVKETNRLTERIAALCADGPVDQEEMPAYAELTRRLGFEYNGMVLHEYYFGNLKRGGGLVGDQLQQREQTLAEQQRAIEEQRQELARNRDLLEELKRRNLEARETERGVVVNLPDVLFEFGRATLTPAAREKTREIAHVLTTQARDRRVLVEGHTD